MNSFQNHHLIALLSAYEDSNLPLDYFISQYFRHHKALGSKDRAIISETIYALIRWKGLLDYLLDTKNIDWTSRLETFQNVVLDQIKSDTSIPPHMRVSFPENLFNLIVDSHGFEQGFEICWNSNFPAPTTIRVNQLKIARDQLFNQWQNDYQISPTSQSKEGIIFHKKINFFNLPEFKQGYFEVQDEGSQLLAQMVDCQPGDLVLDYCSGSGGKTLAFATKMHNKGQIYLHDIRNHILIEAKKRLKRAGIQNAQIVPYESANLRKLKKKMDWILVDAPCSGTGTLRRNPDMKWKFTEESLTRIMGQQRQIFEKALSFLKPGGKIIYATCSLLKGENQKQVEHFTKTYPIQPLKEPFISLPKPNQMDGFFGCIFQSIN